MVLNYIKNKNVEVVIYYDGKGNSNVGGYSNYETIS